MSITTLKLQAKMEEGFSTEISCSHKFFIDQPKQMGGQNLGPNPMEIFLSSIPACLCAVGRIISNQKRLGVRSISVKVEGDLDKNFLMGMTEEGRAGFTEIRVFVDVDADMTDTEKEAYLHEIERRCPIADNIENTTSIKTIIV